MSDQLKVYKPSELVYAATSRCQYGAGLAYAKKGMLEKEGPQHNNWNCSAILTADVNLRIKEQGAPLFGVGVLEQEGGQLHDGPRPFISWEIKSENQPSANGATTRP